MPSAEAIPSFGMNRRPRTLAAAARTLLGSLPARVRGRLASLRSREVRPVGDTAPAESTSSPAPLLVPQEFNRNSSTVTSLMPPEESGKWLLDRMARQLGFESLAGTSVLDFGCGVRFTQAILNGRLPIGEYAGVDCYPAMIEFLRERVVDPRFSFHLLDARHALYNPGGTPLVSSTPLPLPERHFDVACMFSVLTHQYPEDSRAILSILRRHVRPTGRLFFTCFLDDALESFEDRSAERNGGRCFYSTTFLEHLAGETGWAPSARYGAEPPLIGDAFVWRPC